MHTHTLTHTHTCTYTHTLTYTNMHTRTHTHTHTHMHRVRCSVRSKARQLLTWRGRASVKWTGRCEPACLCALCIKNGLPVLGVYKVKEA